MHDRLFNCTSISNQGEKAVQEYAETAYPSSPLSSSSPVSAKTSKHTRCECLDKVRQYAATPAVPSEPNVGGISEARFNAETRRARIEKAYATSDLSQRAELIQRHRIMPTCTCTRELILSVKDASITGVLVQSHFEEPIQVSRPVLKDLIQKNNRQYTEVYGRKVSPVWGLS